MHSTAHDGAPMPVHPLTTATGLWWVLLFLLEVLLLLLMMMEQQGVVLWLLCGEGPCLLVHVKCQLECLLMRIKDRGAPVGHECIVQLHGVVWQSDMRAHLGELALDAMHESGTCGFVGLCEIHTYIHTHPYIPTYKHTHTERERVRASLLVHTCTTHTYNIPTHTIHAIYTTHTHNKSHDATLQPQYTIHNTPPTHTESHDAILQPAQVPPAPLQPYSCP